MVDPSISPGSGSLRDVDVTIELARRPTRPPDHAAENRALVELAHQMAEAPHSILQKLADTALELCHADSAGISILESAGGKPVFRWHATAGDFEPYLGGTTPGDFSPCGVVLDRNAPQLMADPVRYYPYIAELSPHVSELLLIPFYRGDTAIGTIWIVASRTDKRFDAEDTRVMTNLSQFASAAVQAYANLTAIEVGSRSLRDAHIRLESALTAGHAAIWTWDIVKDRVVADANLARLSSVAPEQAASEKLENYARVIHPDDREFVANRIQHSVESGVDFLTEYRVIGTDGQIRWVEARGKVERDQSGKAIALPGVLTDITDRKRAEQEREQLLGQLQEHDKQRNDFLAMLAHELRNPLAAISNAVMLMTMSNEKEHVDYSIQAIRRQTSHLSRLIDDLLDISRMNLDKIELRREILDASPILDSAAQTVKTLIEERKHTLDMTIERGNLWVDADPTRLEQILVNLLNNAAKYSNNGGHIWVSAGHEGDDVVIRVKDAGIGITPEKLPEIFQLFNQADHSSARSEGGLGIGLTIVRKLIEMHGGQITATSEGLGKGSTFTVRLPSAMRPVPAIAVGKRPNDASGPARILVVDDNLDAVQAMAVMLKLAGHDVMTVQSGPEAIECARVYRPQIVLLDLGLPTMNGYDVIKRLREQESGKDALIVAVSGYGQPEDRRRTEAAGFDHHLIKPISYDQLLALLASD